MSIILKRRLLITGLAIFLVMMLLHVAAAQVLREFTERLLHPEGGQGTYVGEVDLNLFTGHLAVSDMHLKRDGVDQLRLGHVEVGISPMGLLLGEIWVKPISIQDAYVNVSRTADGKIVLPFPAAGKGADADADADAAGLTLEAVGISNLLIDYHDGDTGSRLLVKELNLGAFNSSLLEQEIPLSVTAALDNSGLEFKGNLILTAAGPGVAGVINLRSLDMARLQRLGILEEIASGKLSIEGAVELDDVALRFKGAVGADDLRADLQGISLQLAKGRVPEFAFDMPIATPDKPAVSIRKGLSLEGFNLEQQGLGVVLQQVELDGMLELAAGSDYADLRILDSQLALTGIRVVSGEGDSRNTLNINQLLLQQLERQQDASFGQLTVKQGSLAGPAGAAPLNLNLLSVGQSKLDSKNKLALGEIELQGLNTEIAQDAEGRWLLPVAVPPSDNSEPDSTEEQAWSLAGFSLSGDNRIVLSSKQIEPGYRQVVQIENLTVGTLDTAVPGQATSWHITGKLDEYSGFEVGGDMQPLSKEMQVTARGKISSLNLSSLNALVAKDLGHKFKEGQLDDEFELTISGNKLEMSNNLNLLRLDVERQAAEGAEGVPPLELAISLLEDRNGLIALEVPVSGNLDDPDFRVLAALDGIITKAVAGAAALTIQPLGAVLLVGTLVASEAMVVRFKPVEFQPGSSDLDSAAEKYQDDLMAILNKRPKLRLRLCGVAIPADLPAPEKKKKDEKPAAIDEAALLSLAQSRADNFRVAIVAKGVSEDRLRSCRPRVDKQADAKARLEVGL